MRITFAKTFSFFSILSIISLGFIIYSNSFYNGFQFDDVFFIIEKPNLRDISNIKSIWNAHSHPARFVGFYTFALNYHFHQYKVFGYHLVNILIHVTNGILVWWFVNLLFKTKRLKDHPLYLYRPQIALLCALLFVAHPVQTQAVTYISQRFASLATLFYLSALCCYMKGRLSSGKINLVYFGITAILAVLGMFTKQIVFTLPLAIIMTELIFIKDKKVNWQLLTGVALFLLVVPSIFRFNVFNMLSIHHVSESHEGDFLSPLVYLMTQFRVVITYIRLLFIPLGQNLDYDYPAATHFFEPRIFISFFVLLAIVVFAFRLIKKKRVIAFGMLWFFLTLSVESSVITIKNVIFEHRLYLPMLGFVLFLVFSVCTLIKKKRLAFIILSLIVLSYSALTYQRNKVWRNKLTLWSDVIEKSPNKARPHISIAIAYIQYEQYDKAIEHLNRALSINPMAYKAHNNIGLVYSKLDQYPKAIDYYTRAIKINPRHFITYNNRGDMYQRIGQDRLALNDYNKAIELNPYYAQAYINRGVFLGKNKQYELALQDFTRAAQINPTLAESYNNRGIVYQEMNMPALAEADFDQAIKRKRNYADAYYNRGNVYKDRGDFAKAMDDYAQVLKIRNNYSQVYNNRGIIYGSQGKDRLALENFNQAIEFDPKYSAAYFNRSLVYVKKGDYQNALSDTLKAKALGKNIDQLYIGRIQSLIQKNKSKQP